MERTGQEDARAAATDSPEASRAQAVDLGRARAVVEPALAARGLRLVDLRWVTEHAGWTLRVTIEHQPGPEGSSDANGGVTLEDCAHASRDLSAVLDVDDLIPHHYHLEVSSPGLDRPLRTPEEFARFVGKTVRVKLARPAADGQRVLRGPLVEAGAERVAVVADGKRVEVPFADVAEANVVFELTPEPKKSPRASKRAAKAIPRPSPSPAPDDGRSTRRPGAAFDGGAPGKPGASPKPPAQPGR